MDALDIRMLPAQEERVESGPVQFGDDWPGVFIRGDNAAYYAMMLNTLLSMKSRDESPEAGIERMVLTGLVELLNSSNLNLRRNL